MTYPELEAQPETRPPIVSVLTPVYNEASGLESVLQRFREQSDPGGIEFFLIDGASPDRTLEIAQQAADADPRIKVVQNPRRVTSAALNIGLSMARGTYIARMDAHAIYP